MVSASCALAVPEGKAEAADDVPVPETVPLPAGPFVSGSDSQERQYAYRLDEQAYGHAYTRKHDWYADERPRAKRSTDAFEIARTLVTNRQYAAFVEATGHRPPNVERATWEGYGLIHPYARTRRFAWTDGAPPADRPHHPVVLVSHADATAYARWLSRVTGGTWRLPTELQWEKAARGTDGRYFPWGDTWDPSHLNTHDAGPFDTMPVGSFPKGASPYGMLDPAGQVFEWTRERYIDTTRYTVKGGSWDDKGCGVCRPASRHGRPGDLKHILVGFRVVRE